MIQGQMVSKESLGDFNRLSREIEKRRGQIDSLNKCIHFHSQEIQESIRPNILEKAEKLLRNRIESKKTLLKELDDLQKKIRKIR